MERNSLLNSSLREYNNVRDRTTTTTTKMMLNSQVMGQSYGGEDYSSIDGFSRPPTYYTCSFCKRELRSAQALGGHMHAHRRDRARLRQSPPPPPPPNAHYNHHHHHHPTLNLNPGPNSTSLPPSVYTSSLPSFVSPPISALSSPSSASPGELEKWVLNSLDPAPTHGKVSVRLNLEIGQVSDSKEDLDLELRLGHYY